MKIKIAGGCGEHGRNCFYIEGISGAFLVDCGLLAGEEEGGFPHLLKEDISKIQYVFLTHSHADHTGALPWLRDNGFSGEVIASKETLLQLPFKLEHSKTIEEFQKENQTICVIYGRTGHCVGSVWYQFKFEDKMLLFSGDYVEESYVYKKDFIREKYADLAVLDCAYGKDNKSFSYYSNKLISFISAKKKVVNTLLLPVPKFGRGLELYWLLKKNFPDWKYAGDSHFLEQVEQARGNTWIQKGVSLPEEIAVYDENSQADIVFVSDPQLRSENARRIAEQVLQDGHAIMTGTVEKGTLSESLLKEEKMTMLRFPVHLNYAQFKKVALHNSFKRIIAYHTPEYNCTKEIEI